MKDTRDKLLDDTYNKREDILEKFYKIKEINRNDYNKLCDIETILDNIDFFIELKNNIQRME